VSDDDAPKVLLLDVPGFAKDAALAAVQVLRDAEGSHPGHIMYTLLVLIDAAVAWSGMPRERVIKMLAEADTFTLPIEPKDRKS
jgi:hypothetical protein